jgi:tight adherence protein B
MMELLDRLSAWLPEGWTLGAVDMRFVLYVALFVGVLLAIQGIQQLTSRDEFRDEARNRRMRMLQAGKSAEEVLSILRKQPKETPLSRIPFFGDLPAAIDQAAIPVRPGVFVAGMVAGFLVVAISAAQVVGVLPAAGIASLLFLVIPVMIVKNLRKKRLEKFTAQMPDALELMARGLRVGHPVNTTLQSVATEMADPIASEFGIVVDQVLYGDDLVDALHDLTKRVDVEDVHYFAVSVGIQHGSGGDLSQILDTLSQVIRGRMILRTKIRAISSEARLSGIFLSCIPVFILAFMMISLPSYYGDVSDDPLFIPMLVATFTFIVLNALVLRRLVRFRI